MIIQELRSFPRKTFGWSRNNLLRIKLWRADLQAHKAVERQSGSIDAKLRARAIEDATERLGGRRHASGLMMYAALSGEYKEGWLPSSYYFEHVRPRVNGTLHHMARHAIANQLFRNTSMFPDLLYVVNGRLLRPDRASMTSDAAIELLRDIGSEVIFKRDSSGFGLGVQAVRTSALDDLTNFPNGVFQRRIISHPALDVFGMNSLSTLRIGTILPDNGPPEIRMSYLKVGRQKDAHVLAQDQIRLAVNYRTGEVDGSGFSTRWEKLDHHPDSGFSFANICIPQFDTATRAVLALHAELPFARFICWDLAVCAGDRVHVLEWEGGVPSFGEPVQGPCFLGLAWDCLHQRENG